jgi:hypothetical protein
MGASSVSGVLRFAPYTRERFRPCAPLLDGRSPPAMGASSVSGVLRFAPYTRERFRPCAPREVAESAEIRLDARSRGSQGDAGSSPEASHVQPISSPPTGARGDDLYARAVGFLEAVSAAEDRAVELAAGLGDVVLDASGARLALAVLEGGPLTITRAVRLARRVMLAQAQRRGLLYRLPRAGQASGRRSAVRSTIRSRPGVLW